jgi:hypothetical protein
MPFDWVYTHAAPMAMPFIASLAPISAVLPSDDSATLAPKYVPAVPLPSAGAISCCSMNGSIRNG